MSGIFPDATSNGLPASDSNVVNGFTTGAAFSTTCTPLFLGSNGCSSRITPAQANAWTSEMLALAEAFDPDGTWDCNSVTNLAASFAEFANSISVPASLPPDGPAGGDLLGTYPNPTVNWAGRSNNIVNSIIGNPAAIQALAAALIDPQNTPINEVTLGDNNLLYVNS